MESTLKRAVILNFVYLICSYMIQMLENEAERLSLSRCVLCDGYLENMRYFENEWAHTRKLLRLGPHKHQKQSGSAKYIKSYK